jgi:hypothetical protein
MALIKYKARKYTRYNIKKMKKYFEEIKFPGQVLNSWTYCALTGSLNTAMNISVMQLQKR